MEIFDPYSHALAALAGYAILMMVLGALSTMGRSAENRCDCGQVKRDYSDPAYRRGRAFLNAIEMSGPFTMATLAAILTGGTAFWVNLLAAMFLLARIIMAVVHIKTENQPMRSTFWSVSAVCVAALALIGLFGAF